MERRERQKEAEIERLQHVAEKQMQQARFASQLEAENRYLSEKLHEYQRKTSLNDERDRITVTKSK